MDKRIRQCFVCIYRTFETNFAADCMLLHQNPYFPVSRYDVNYDKANYYATDCTKYTPGQRIEEKFLSKKELTPEEEKLIKVYNIYKNL